VLERVGDARSPRRLALPLTIESWSPTSLQRRLFKTGGRHFRRARYFTVQLGEIHLTGTLFRQIVGGIKRLTCRPLEGGRRLAAAPATRRLARVTENDTPMPKALYEKHPDFVARRIADEVVLVPISRKVGEIDSLYVLNEVGARIWELIDGRSLKELRDAIVEQFEVSESTAQDDLTVLIEQLKEIGAIQEVP